MKNLFIHKLKCMACGYNRALLQAKAGEARGKRRDEARKKNGIEQSGKINVCRKRRKKAKPKGLNK
jgi:hypothetical protein